MVSRRDFRERIEQVPAFFELDSIIILESAHHELPLVGEHFDRERQPVGNIAAFFHELVDIHDRAFKYAAHEHSQEMGLADPRNALVVEEMLGNIHIFARILDDPFLDQELLEVSDFDEIHALPVQLAPPLHHLFLAQIYTLQSGRSFFRSERRSRSSSVASFH